MIETGMNDRADAGSKKGISNNSDASRKFGMANVGSVPRGRHLCQFYFTKKDLIDTLVPYFAEGLRSNESCMWVTSAPLEVEGAKKALRRAVPDLDERIDKGQIEILPSANWYFDDGKFDATKLLLVLLHKEAVALRRGFQGLRATGNTVWLERRHWIDFMDYEARLNAIIPSHRVTALCTYSLDKCTGSDVLTVLRNHSGTF